MCDTLVALPAATADGSILFAKNSDREPNEAQGICTYPAREHPAGSVVECTYIRIPQARHTHAVLLSRPFQMWGAEMGANEHGVVIGNEALYTRVSVPATGLTGMDLLRLGLERAASAAQALEVITDLLAVHGQGGSGGYRHTFYYNNSYLIAGRDGAWVLETVGREWAACRVHNTGSISNAITIGNEWDLASPGLAGEAVRRRWCRGAEDFDFARCYTDPLIARFTGARQRRGITSACLAPGGVTPETLMTVLRSHGPDDLPPARASNSTPCMHYAGDLIRKYQTTASFVAHLRADGAATYWLTGTAAPCLCIFKPFYLDAPLPDLGPDPTATADPAALWWQGERLHRAVLGDYEARYACIAPTRDGLEAAFLRDEAALHAASAGPEERAQFSAACLGHARRATEEWIAAVESMPANGRAPWLYRRNWERQSRAAGLH